MHMNRHSNTSRCNFHCHHLYFCAVNRFIELVGLFQEKLCESSLLCSVMTGWFELSVSDSDSVVSLVHRRCFQGLSSGWNSASRVSCAQSWPVDLSSVFQTLSCLSFTVGVFKVWVLAETLRVESLVFSHDRLIWAQCFRLCRVSRSPQVFSRSEFWLKLCESSLLCSVMTGWFELSVSDSVVSLVHCRCFQGLSSGRYSASRVSCAQSWAVDLSSVFQTLTLSCLSFTAGVFKVWVLAEALRVESLVLSHDRLIWAQCFRLCCVSRSLQVFSRSEFWPKLCESSLLCSVMTGWFELSVSDSDSVVSLVHCRCFQGLSSGWNSASRVVLSHDRLIWAQCFRLCRVSRSPQVFSRSEFWPILCESSLLCSVMTGWFELSVSYSVVSLVHRRCFQGLSSGWNSASRVSCAQSWPVDLSSVFQTLSCLSFTAGVFKVWVLAETLRVESLVFSHDRLIWAQCFRLCRVSRSLQVFSRSEFWPKLCESSLLCSVMTGWFELSVSDSVVSLVHCRCFQGLSSGRNSASRVSCAQSWPVDLSSVFLTLSCLSFTAGVFKVWVLAETLRVESLVLSHDRLIWAQCFRLCRVSRSLQVFSRSEFWLKLCGSSLLCSVMTGWFELSVSDSVVSLVHRRCFQGLSSGRNSASRVSCAQSWPVDLSSVFQTLSCLSFTAGVFKVWVLAETLRVESLVLSHDRLIWAQCFRLWLCRVSRSPQVFSRSEFWPKLCESILLCSVMTGWFELSVSDSVVSLVHCRCFQGLSSGETLRVDSLVLSHERLIWAQCFRLCRVSRSLQVFSRSEFWPKLCESSLLCSVMTGWFELSVSDSVVSLVHCRCFQGLSSGETLRVESLVLSHDRLIWAQCFWRCRVSRSLQVFSRSEFWPKLCESSLLCSVMTGWFELSVSDSVVSLVHRRCFQGLSSGWNSASRVSCAQSWPVDLSSVFQTLSCLSFTAGVFKVWVLAETLRVESLVLSHDRLIWAQCFWLCRVSRSLQVFSRSEFWPKLCESILLCSVMTGWFELSVSDAVVSLVHCRCFQGLSSGWNSASRVSCAQSWPVDLSSVFQTLSCLSFTAGVFKVWVLAETLRVESLVLSHDRLIWAQCFRLCRVSRSLQVFSRSEFWPKLCESSLLCSVMTGWFELSVSDSVVSLVHCRCFQGLSSGRNSASRVSCAQSWPVDLSSVFLTLSCLSFTAGVFKVWVLAETLRVESLVLSHDRLIWAQCFRLCRVSRSLQVFSRSEFWPILCESSLLCSVMTGWFELSVSDTVVSLVHRRCFQGLSSGRNSASRVSCAQSWPVDLSSVFQTLSCLLFTAGVFKVWVLAKLCESSLLCSVMTGWFELSVSDAVVSLVHCRCFQGLSSGWNSASRVSCAQSWPVDLSSVFLTLSCLSFTAGVFKVWVLAETLRVESLVLSHDRLIWAQCFWRCRVSRSLQVFSRSEFWPKLCESILLCSVMTGWFELSVSDSVVSLVHRRCFQGLSSGWNSASRVSCAQSWPVDLSSVFQTLSCLSFTAGVFKVWVLSETLRVESLVLSHDRLIWAQCFRLCRVSRSLQVFSRSEFWPKLCESSLLCSVMTGWFELSVSDSVVSLVHCRCFQGLSSGRNSASRVSCAQSWPVDLSSVFQTLSCLSFTAGVFKVWVLAETLRVESLVLSHDRLIWAQCFWLCRVSRSPQVFSRSEFWPKLCESSLLCSVMTGWFELSVSDSVVSLVHCRCFQGLSSGRNSASRVSCAQSWPVDLSSVFQTLTLSCLSFTAGVFKVWVLAETLRVDSLVLSHDRLIWAQCFRLCRVSRSLQVFSRSEFWRNSASRFSCAQSWAVDLSSVFQTLSCLSFTAGVFKVWVLAETLRVESLVLSHDRLIWAQCFRLCRVSRSLQVFSRSEFWRNSASRVSCAQSWPVDLSSVFQTLSCLSFTAGVFKVWVLAETLRVESLVLSHDRLIWAQCFRLCRVSRSPQVFSRSEFWLKLCESSLLCSVMTGWFELSVSDSVVSLVHRRCFQGLSSGWNSASRVSCAQSWPVDLSSVFQTLSCLSFTAGVFKVWVLAETLRVESLVLSHDRLIWAQCFRLCRVSRSLQVFSRSEFWRNSASRVSCAQSWPVDLSSVFQTLSCLSFTAGVFKVWVLAETLRVESLVLSHDRLIWAQCFRLCRVSRSPQVFSRSEFWLKLCESSLLCSVMTGWFELSVSDSVVSLVHRRCFQGLSSGWNSASRVSCAQSWPVDLSSVFQTLSCLSFTAGVFKVWVLAETLRVESLVLSHDRLIWAQCFWLCRVSRSLQVFSRSEFWPKLCESSLLYSVMTGWFELSVSDSVVSLVHCRCF